MLYTVSPQTMEKMSPALAKYFRFMGDLLLKHPFIPDEFLERALMREFKELTHLEARHMLFLWKKTDDTL